MSERTMERVSGVELIAQERQRQVEEEGWTAEHDDGHDCDDLAHAARCYTMEAIRNRSLPGIVRAYPPQEWPWMDGWNPSPDPIRNLVKAGALIAAEIDRLQRLEDRND